MDGYNLVEQDSEQKTGQGMVSKRGCPGLRHMLYVAAMVAVARSREFRALYPTLTARHRNPVKGKQATVGVATKILGILFALVRSGETYSAGKVLREGRGGAPAKVVA